MKKMVLNLQSKQPVSFCFKKVNRSDLDHYSVKKDKNQDERDFDWRKPFTRGLKVYGLFIGGDKSLQGLIAVIENYDEDFLCLEIDIIESALQNKKIIKGKNNNNRKYIGIGKTLIAFAC